MSTTIFELRANDNHLIQSIELNKGTGDVATDEFFGSFTLPTEPFRAYVKGIDESGKGYSRAFPRVFIAQTVKITPEIPFIELTPNKPLTINFTVTNFGDLGDFSISSSETIGLITHIEPSTVTLATNETTTVEASLSIPDGVSFENDQNGSLIVEVQSLSSTEINNTAVVQLGVKNLIHAIIDIKPGDSNNHVNLNSNGVISVAILTTKLTDGDAYDFDVNQIDLSRLTLSGADVLKKGNSGNICTLKDIDNDGDQDLLVHFYTDHLNLDTSSVSAEIKGVLLSGARFIGSDSISQVPAK